MRIIVLVQLFEMHWSQILFWRERWRLLWCALGGTRCGSKNMVMMHAWPVPPVSVGVYVQVEVVPCCKEGKWTAHEGTTSSETLGRFYVNYFIWNWVRRWVNERSSPKKWGWSWGLICDLVHLNRLDSGVYTITHCWPATKHAKIEQNTWPMWLLILKDKSIMNMKTEKKEEEITDCKWMSHNWQIFKSTFSPNRILIFMGLPHRLRICT